MEGFPCRFAYVSGKAPIAPARGGERWEPAGKEAGGAGLAVARARPRTRATAAGPGSDGRGLPSEEAARPQAVRVPLSNPRVLPDEVPARPDPV